MANIRSAEKQNRKMIKNRARNRAAMAAIRTAVKKARTAVDTKAGDAPALVGAAVAVRTYESRLQVLHFVLH